MFRVGVKARIVMVIITALGGRKARRQTMMRKVVLAVAQMRGGPNCLDSLVADGLSTSFWPSACCSALRERDVQQGQFPVTPSVHN